MRSSLCGWVRSSTGALMLRSALVTQLAACRQQSLPGDDFSAQEHAALDDLLAQVRRSPNIRMTKSGTVGGAGPRTTPTAASSVVPAGEQSRQLPPSTVGEGSSSSVRPLDTAADAGAVQPQPSQRVAPTAAENRPSVATTSTTSASAPPDSAHTLSTSATTVPSPPLTRKEDRTTTSSSPSAAATQRIPPKLRCGATAVVNPLAAVNQKLAAALRSTTPHSSHAPESTRYAVAPPLAVEWDVVLASAPYQSLLSRVRQAWTELGQERFATTEISPSPSPATQEQTATYSKRFLDLCVAPITEMVGYQPLTAHDINKFLPEVDAARVEATMLAAAAGGDQRWFVWRQSVLHASQATTVVAARATRSDETAVVETAAGSSPSLGPPHGREDGPRHASAVVYWVDHSWEAFVQRGLEAVHLSWEPLDVVGRRLFSGVQLPLSVQDLARYLFKFSTSINSAAATEKLVNESNAVPRQPLVELSVLYQTAHRDVLTVLPLERDMLPSVEPSTTLVIRRARTVDAPPSVVEAVRLLGVSTAVPPNRSRTPPHHDPTTAGRSNLPKSSAVGVNNGSDFVVLLRRLNDELTSLSADAGKTKPENTPEDATTVSAAEHDHDASSALLGQAVQRLVPLEQALRVRLSEFSVPSRYLDSGPASSPEASSPRQPPASAAGPGVRGAGPTEAQGRGASTSKPASSSPASNNASHGRQQSVRESSTKRALHGPARRAHELRVAIVIAKQRMKSAASATEQRQHAAVLRQLRDELVKQTELLAATGGGNVGVADERKKATDSNTSASTSSSSSRQLSTTESSVTAPPQRRPEGRFQKKAKA